MPATLDSTAMLAILQQQLAHSQAQQQQQQQQQFQLMYEASERRAREQAEESRLAREATQAHNAEVISRLTAQMEEQKATIARLADASSATPKKEDPLGHHPDDEAALEGWGPTDTF